MLGASSMLCSHTFTFTTFSSDEPAASSTCLRLIRICRVSLAVVPRTRSPDCGSTAVRPHTKRKSPPLTTADTAWPKLLPASSAHTEGTITSRLGDIGWSLERGSSGCDDVELDLEAGLDLCRPYGARRWAVRHADRRD